MVLGSTGANRVLLVAEHLVMEEEADLNLFYITDHHLVNVSHPRKGVTMEIKLKRKIMGEMMTTYLPSMLLMMITYATTFFKPLLIEAALSVNLTTMLVMTTIFTNLMDKLPPTAYVKMIDIWLIGGQLIPFIEVVLLTIIEMLRDGDGSGTQTINHHGQPRVLKVGGLERRESDIDCRCHDQKKNTK